MSTHTENGQIEAERQLLTTLHEVSLLSSRLFNLAVRDMGLTRTQWMVLYQLYLNGNQSQTEIARALSLAKPPLGKVIDLLERDGWLTRRRSPKDRRENIVALTAKVDPLIGPLSKTVSQISRQAFTGISLKQQDLFIRRLEQIRENMRSSLEAQQHTHHHQSINL